MIYHRFTKDRICQCNKYAQQRHEKFSNKPQWLIYLQKYIGRGINNVWNMNIQG